MMTNDQEAFHAPDEEHHKRALWKRIVFLLGITGLAGTAVGLAIIAGVIVYFSQGLPNHTIVEDYRPKTTTRIYAGDGQLLDEFAVETRIFLPIEFVPEQVRLAFLAAEDQYFYQHFGVNPLSIFRAVVDNVGHVLNGRRTVGASTITQQVAREFLLSGSQSERSIDRKIREALLAIRIEQTLTKDQILELYLNQIYLGLRAYGIAAASLHYFDKPVTDLTIAEAAYLAALPKGPANYHPLRAHENAVARRNWVIGRMVDSGFITKQEATDARQETLIADVRRKNIATFRAEYFVEEVRRELIERYGRLSVYEDGFLVRTSVDSTMQATAERALRFGLLAYDRRHGYAGVIQNLIDSASHPRPQWHEALIATPLPAGTPNHWEIAVVLGTTRQQAIIQTADLAVGTIALDDMLWARERIAEVEKERTRSDSLDSLGIIDQRETTQRRSQLLGKKIGKPSDVLREGDVILVQLKASAGDSQEGASASPTFDAVPITHVDGDTAAYTPNAFYTLEQVPEIEGGIIALDPHTGRILAMSGGWSFFRSQFNRTTQAKRQPGSSFKPFVYLAALENGYTPATRILDAPIVLDGWKPGNYGQRYYGPSLMRVGIERSRNLMTIRLSETVGIDKVAEVAERFGVVDEFVPNPSGALGTQETTLLRMVAAYGQIANGGKKVTPSLIDRIQDAEGNTVFLHDDRPCRGCTAAIGTAYAPPKLPDNREQVADRDSTFQISYMLQGVVDRGTGASVRRQLTRPLAGKTGTTDDTLDTWFIGYSPDLVVGIFIGFDTPKSLGMFSQWRQESASSVAVPVFTEFMAHALQDAPSHPFRSPSSIRFVRIDTETGGLSRYGITQREFAEAFKKGEEPNSSVPSELITGTTSEEPTIIEEEDVPEGATIISDIPTDREIDTETETEDPGVLF